MLVKGKHVTVWLRGGTSFEGVIERADANVVTLRCAAEDVAGNPWRDAPCLVSVRAAEIAAVELKLEASSCDT